MAKKQANPIDIQVGNRVRIRRMLIGMSQEKLGDMLGLTFQQVQKYEKGVNRIGAGRLFEVSRILNVPVDFFYEGVSAAGEVESDGAPVMEFVSSGEGLQLALAFMKTKRRSPGSTSEKSMVTSSSIGALSAFTSRVTPQESTRVSLLRSSSKPMPNSSMPA